MVHRLINLSVFAFWAFMTTIYLQTQLSPDRQFSWLRVPPEHIVELIFESKENSLLEIFQGEVKLGSITLKPIKRKNGNNEMELNGDFLLQIPGTKPQRIYFTSKMTFLPGHTMESMEFMLKLRDPKMVLTVAASGDDDTIRYKVESDAFDEEKQTTLPELLSSNSIEIPGLTRDALQSLGNDSKIQAGRAVIKIKGQDVNVYRLVFFHTEDLSTEINVSHLGRILTIHTPLGYHMQAEGLQL